MKKIDGKIDRYLRKQKIDTFAKAIIQDLPNWELKEVIEVAIDKLYDHNHLSPDERYTLQSHWRDLIESDI